MPSTKNKARTTSRTAKATPPKGIDTREARNRKLTRKDVKKAAARSKNWGRWGKDDEIGTLNFTTAKDIVAAGAARQGKAKSCRSRSTSTSTGRRARRANIPRSAASIRSIS